MAKKKSPSFRGTATGSRLIEDDEPPAKAHPKDVNLPDPMRGEPIAEHKGNKHVRPHTVKGGDESDPRWASYFQDRAESNEARGLEPEGKSWARSNAKRNKEYNRKYIRPLKDKK